MRPVFHGVTGMRFGSLAQNKGKIRADSEQQ